MLLFSSLLVNMVKTSHLIVYGVAGALIAVVVYRLVSGGLVTSAGSGAASGHTCSGVKKAACCNKSLQQLSANNPGLVKRHCEGCNC